MSMIKHYPISKIDKVIQHYSEKDGVPIKYVCTTDLSETDTPVDIFYRESAHPEFGNHYFGLYFRSLDQNTMICNADKVEQLNFGMVYNDDGDLEYSQSRHDYKSFKNGNMIDGGRDYIRSSGKFKIYSVRNGELVENDPRMS